MALRSADANSGTPCIDFAPDDRWQINDDEAANSKNKDSKCSNGRRSMRLRNSKSCDSTVTNGEAAVSSSEDESNKNIENSQPNAEASPSASLNIRETRSKRKRTVSDSNEEKAPAEKKTKSNNVSTKQEVTRSQRNAKCNQDKKMEKEDLPSSDCDESSKKNGPDLDTSIEIIEMKNGKSECPEKTVKEKVGRKSDVKLKDVDHEIMEVDEEDNPKADSKTNDSEKDSVDTEMKTVDAEEEEKLEDVDDQEKEEVDQEKAKEVDDQEKTKDVNDQETAKEVDVQEIAKEADDEEKAKEGDSDIEVIDDDEDDKDSDSEIQVIASEDSLTSGTVDFPTPSTSTPSNIDVRLTSGYPFYNSLKEKMPAFKAGDYKPVKFPHTGTLLLGEKEVIIESPSLLVPLLIKEADEIPHLEGVTVKKDKVEENKTIIDTMTLMKNSMIAKKNFFQSSVGQFLINLGNSRVQEWFHRDMKHLKAKQFRKKKATEEDLGKILEMHEHRHEELKQINAIFNFRMRQCGNCAYKTESQVILEGHQLTPHVTSRREYQCNFCTYFTRDTEQIVFHYEAMHGRKAVLEANTMYHECIFCSFQSHLKTKVNAHMTRCRKHFIPSQNLAPPFDFEFPGVTTKPVTIADVIGHRRMLLNSAKNRIMPVISGEDSSALARKKLASVLTKLTSQNAFVENPNLMKQLMSPQNAQISGGNLQLPPGIMISRPRGTMSMSQMRPMGRFTAPRNMTIRGGIPYTTSLTTNLASAGISITPVSRNGAMPRPNAATGVKNVTLTPITSQKPGGSPQPVALFTNLSGQVIGQPIPARSQGAAMAIRGVRPPAPYQRLNTPPSQVVKGSSGNTFVVCEICDSYIKDLEELRTHMNWVHKVKIHPKMLASRPPLNCQKCQWRFFTDQGLERHLLGAHGLVTTNMQEMANKNQDGGRCIICGAVFTYKLVSHMTQVHKVTLKPAHLSYKCTVCTATFTLYRLFESHVYNVHSGSNKKDTSGGEIPEKKTSEPVAKGPKKCKECGFVTENMHDHLVKKHLRDCAVKMCHIEKCEKCLYSSDEMLVIRMSDFGLEEEDSEDSSSSDDDGGGSAMEEEDSSVVEEVKTDKG